MKQENIKDSELISQLNSKYKEFKKEISKAIVGQEKIIDNIIISILTRGHSLLIGVPGLAKTLIVKTIAECMDLKFSRIQFTPDLMPADITGTEILEGNNSQKGFRFLKGPIFANIILADEINQLRRLETRDGIYGVEFDASFLCQMVATLRIFAAGEGDEHPFALATPPPRSAE